MSRLLAILSLTFLLISCSTFRPEPGVSLSTCPPPVWMDAPVAAELENVPQEGYANFWQWVARVEKLNMQLEACR